MRAIMSVCNILITEVYRKFDKNCLKLLKIRKFWRFCLFLGSVFSQNRIYLFAEDYLTTNSCLVDCFQRSNLQCQSKKLHKNCKTWEILEFLSFSGSFCVIKGSSFLKKTPKIFTDTNRTMLNLCELNSMGNTLKVKYKFGAWQIL